MDVLRAPMRQHHFAKSAAMVPALTRSMGDQYGFIHHKENRSQSVVYCQKSTKAKMPRPLREIQMVTTVPLKEVQGWLRSGFDQ